MTYSVSKFLQPLVILIWPTTCSAAEDFLLALKMKAPKRDVLIGTPTGGSTGAPLVRYLNSACKKTPCQVRKRQVRGLRSQKKRSPPADNAIWQ